MSKDILQVACVGWLDHRDENLIQSIILMSKNVEEVVYPIIDSSNTFQTSPLIFDFFDRPVVFIYNQEGPDLLNHIKNNILTRSNRILVNLGGYVSDVDYLQREDQADVLYLKALIKMIKQSDLPIIYTLNSNVSKHHMNLIKESLDISTSSIFMTYDYFQPGKLKHILLKLFEINA